MSGLEPSMMLEKVATHRQMVMARIGYERLAPILRVLLTTDGTVTEVLSAFYGEEIDICVLSQGFRAYEGQHNQELNAQVGTRMLDRSIVLSGRRSGAIYAAAFSRIVPSHLPIGMQEALLAGRDPIGKLMLDQHLETFREIVSCGECPAADVPHLGERCVAALQVPSHHPVVWRTLCATFRAAAGGSRVCLGGCVVCRTTAL